MPGALSQGGLAGYGAVPWPKRPPTTIGDLAASGEINFD